MAQKVAKISFLGLKSKKKILKIKASRVTSEESMELKAINTLLKEDDRSSVIDSVTNNPHNMLYKEMNDFSNPSLKRIENPSKHGSHPSLAQIIDVRAMPKTQKSIKSPKSRKKKKSDFGPDEGLWRSGSTTNHRNNKIVKGLVERRDTSPTKEPKNSYIDFSVKNQRRKTFSQARRPSSGKEIYRLRKNAQNAKKKADFKKNQHFEKFEKWDTVDHDWHYGSQGYGMGVAKRPGSRNNRARRVKKYEELGSEAIYNSEFYSAKFDRNEMGKGSAVAKSHNFDLDLFRNGKNGQFEKSGKLAKNLKIEEMSGERRAVNFNFKINHHQSSPYFTAKKKKSKNKNFSTQQKNIQNTKKTTLASTQSPPVIKSHPRSTIKPSKKLKMPKNAEIDFKQKFDEKQQRLKKRSYMQFFLGVSDEKLRCMLIKQSKGFVQSSDPTISSQLEKEPENGSGNAVEDSVDTSLFNPAALNSIYNKKSFERSFDSIAKNRNRGPREAVNVLKRPSSGVGGTTSKDYFIRNASKPKNLVKKNFTETESFEPSDPMMMIQNAPPCRFATKEQSVKQIINLRPTSAQKSKSGKIAKFWRNARRKLRKGGKRSRRKRKKLELSEEFEVFRQFRQKKVLFKGILKLREQAIKEQKLKQEVSQGSAEASVDSKGKKKRRKNPKKFKILKAMKSSFITFGSDKNSFKRQNREQRSSRNYSSNETSQRDEKSHRKMYTSFESDSSSRMENSTSSRAYYMNYAQKMAQMGPIPTENAILVSEGDEAFNDSRPKFNASGISGKGVKMRISPFKKKRFFGKNLVRKNTKSGTLRTSALPGKGTDRLDYVEIKPFVRDQAVL